MQALAPLPSPDDRELRRRPFRVDSPSKVVSAASPYDGTFVTLRFTAANWYLPQTVTVLADDVVEFTDKPSPLFTRPELGDAAEYTYDDPAFEGLRFAVVNHVVTAEFDPPAVLPKPDTVSGTSFTDSGGGFSDELVGRAVEIVSGVGIGEVRFIRARSGNTMTLDREWKPGRTPDTDSEYLIRTDDALVGVVSDFTNDEDTSDFTFTDTAGGFPIVGEGLRARSWKS